MPLNRLLVLRSSSPSKLLHRLRCPLVLFSFRIRLRLRLGRIQSLLLLTTRGIFTLIPLCLIPITRFRRRAVLCLRVKRRLALFCIVRSLRLRCRVYLSGCASPLTVCRKRPRSSLWRTALQPFPLLGDTLRWVRSILTLLLVPLPSLWVHRV